MPVAHSAEWLRQKEKSSDEYLELKKHQQGGAAKAAASAALQLLLRVRA